MSFAFVSDIRQTQFGRDGLAVIGDSNNYLHVAFDRANASGPKLTVSGKGNFDMPGCICAGSVDRNGQKNGYWGVRPWKAERLQAGKYKITHGIGHIDYYVTANIVSSAFMGSVIVMEKTATYVVLGTGGVDGVLYDNVFDFQICGRN
ncbi:MAG: hypothetical protein RR066_08595 [Mucinivorans sp.]